MKASTKDQIEGAFHKVKGKVKETAGRATNNPDLEIDGQSEKIVGKVQQKVGQIKKVFEKVKPDDHADEVLGAFSE